MCDGTRIREVGPRPHEGSGLPASAGPPPQLTQSLPLLLVHGGAGRRRMTAAQSACLAEALNTGFSALLKGGPAMLAVESAVRVLEESGLFNAGRGAKRQLDDVQRMDASIMEGTSLRAGAVASIEGVLHPISAARLVMEKTDHVLLVGPMAARFARHWSLARLPRSRPGRRLSYQAMLEKQRITRVTDRHGTVGAAAVDRNGAVAAGASTGGIDSMLPGRVGDTPLVGCGVYADDRCGAVSMTGIGEGIIRMAVAKSICDRLACGSAPAAAAKSVLRRLVSRIDGSAGTLVVTPGGRFAIAHVTPHMAAGWRRGNAGPVIRDRWP
ncbi:MAG TPA: isoaspartyl peptidase/L-asparaginase family protein [Nitrospira sp.]|nr:isoaspartyl peptidase/L-asparaginase family protein [Nitrospira sp.]